MRRFTGFRRLFLLPALAMAENNTSYGKGGDVPASRTPPR